MKYYDRMMSNNVLCNCIAKENNGYELLIIGNDAEKNARRLKKRDDAKKEWRNSAYWQFDVAIGSAAIAFPAGHGDEPPKKKFVAGQAT